MRSDIDWGTPRKMRGGPRRPRRRWIPRPLFEGVSGAFGGILAQNVVQLSSAFCPVQRGGGGGGVPPPPWAHTPRAPTWSGAAQGGGGWHKASVSDCVPLAAPIGLSPLHTLTLCGPERVLVVSTEPPDDLSCLTTPGVCRPGDGAVARVHAGVCGLQGPGGGGGGTPPAACCPRRARRPGSCRRSWFSSSSDWR